MGMFIEFCIITYISIHVLSGKIKPFMSFFCFSCFGLDFFNISCILIYIVKQSRGDAGHGVFRQLCVISHFENGEARFYSQLRISEDITYESRSAETGNQRFLCSLRMENISSNLHETQGFHLE